MRRIKNKKKHKKEEKSRHPCSSLPSSIVMLDTCSVASVTEKEPSDPLSFYSFEDGSYGPEPPVTEPSNLEASASSS